MYIGRNYTISKMSKTYPKIKKESKTEIKEVTENKETLETVDGDD